MTITLHSIPSSSLPALASRCSLFASREWAAIYGEELQAYELKSDSGEVQASFCLFQRSKWGLSYTISPPFAPHIGLNILVKPNEKEVSRASRVKDIHRAIAGYLKERKDILIEIALSTDEHDSQPYTWQDFNVNPRHTYLMELNHDVEVLRSAMSPERRKNIRKAEQDGLEVIKTNDATRVREILDHTIARQRIQLNSELLDRLLSANEIAENRTLYVCRHRDKDIAVSLVVWDKNRTYYLIGGYDEAEAHQGGGTLNIWTAIQDAKERGNSIFDFEGSMIPSVERYFRGFGGELHTFFSVSHHSRLGRLIKRFKSS